MIWLNGTLLDPGEAHIGVDERGFLLGDGLFETMRFEAGTIRRWERHLARLKDGVTTLGLGLDTTLDIPAIAAELARRNALASALIRLTVTRGPGGRGLDASACEPTILVTASPLTVPEEGPRLVTLNAPRRAPLTLAAHFKMIGYGDNILARRLAREQGGDMAVMLSPEGRIACADSANLFWVTGRTVYTPSLDTGALNGTTRAAILDGFTARGLHVEQDHFRLESLASAEAIIVTNAVLGARPAISLDANPLKTDSELVRLICDIERSAH
ncbi:aminotransferase class IV [Glycocaulis sp.]|uniref:aminotransferase class IV n=1 Tax=Glycocaulis sp. TaxID=1969725 RepID=UPI003D2305A4